MNIIKLLLATVVILSCSEQQIWQEIETGKTVKVFSKGFNINNTNYIFKWSKPTGSENSESNYTIENDKLLFTPFTTGEFTISLEIVNMMDTKVYEEIFYFNVIEGDFPNTALEESITKDSQNNYNIKEQNNSNNKLPTIKNKRYTIQVASWTSLDKAKIDMDELINLGFDTYVEEYFDKKNNITRWRVRVGSFENRNLAQDVKNKLSKFRGENPWIAYIK